MAVMAVFPSSTGSTDFLLPEPPGAAAPFCEHGDRPLPVQARKCPKLTGGKDNAEILSHAAVQQSKKQRKPPAYLPYRIEAPKALDAADKAKEEAALYYPQYQKIQVDSVTEVRDL